MSCMNHGWKKADRGRTLAEHGSNCLLKNGMPAKLCVETHCTNIRFGLKDKDYSHSVVSRESIRNASEYEYTEGVVPAKQK